MNWWEIIAVFVGIPTLALMGIWTLVSWLSESREPDGLRWARRSPAEEESDDA